MSEVDTYKIFRELEAREKRANPYKFYDKDELIDEILKDEDEIERLKEENKKYNKWIESLNKDNHRLNNIIKEVREYIEEWQKFPHTNGSTHKELKNLIDILDKGE